MTRTERPNSPRRPRRVAWYHPFIPHYRVPVINRLGDLADIDLTVFAGHAIPGLSQSDAAANLTAPRVTLRNVAFLRTRLPIVLAYASGWTRIVRSRQDAVIALEWSRDLVLWLLLATRWLFGFKLILLGHIRLLADDGPIRHRLRRFLVRASDGVIAYTTEGMEQALAWGVDPSAVVAMGNTLDEQRIARAKASVTEARTTQVRNDLGLDGPVYLFIARPTAAKRLDVAIDTVRMLADRGVPAHLLVVGTSNALQFYIDRAKGLPTVHFLGEVLDEDDLAVFFAVADLVLIPGAVGLAANHAFAYGRPLVTARGEPHGPEMVLAQDGRNALLVEACEATVFASTLEALTRAPDRLRALQQGAEATEVPTVGAMVDNIARLIRSVTPKSSRA